MQNKEIQQSSCSLTKEESYTAPNRVTRIIETTNSADKKRIIIL